MLKSSLCDYSDAYILVKGTMTVPNTAVTETDANNVNKNVILDNCAPFINCTSEINNAQVDDAKDIDIIMPMYNLIEYSDNNAKKHLEVYGNTVKIYQPAVNNNGKIVEFNGVIATIHLILNENN